jgi:hypothetical protein
MKNKKFSAIDKILVSLGLISLIIWFGMNMARTIIAFDVFEPGQAELIVKNYYTQGEIARNVTLYYFLSLYTTTAFILLLISAIILAVRLISKAKQKGWILISIILFALAVPVELYRIYLDTADSIQINSLYESFENDIPKYNESINEMFFERMEFTAVRIAGIIAYLSVLSSVIFMVFRPLEITGEKLQE